MRALRQLLLFCCCSSALAVDATPLPPQEESPRHQVLRWPDVFPETDGPCLTYDAPLLGIDDEFPPNSDVDFPPSTPALPVVPPFLDSAPSDWFDPLTQDHALIYRETRNDTSFVSHRGGFGLTTLGVVLGMRIGTSGVFSLQPRFGWHFLHGPLQPDLPPQLYDLTVETNFAKQINDVWSLHLHVAPTLATDFDNKDSEAFRLIAGGLVAVQLTPLWKLVGGLTYLDRPDLPVVPIAGLRLRVDDLAVDLLVPRPRIAYRYQRSKDYTESWVYVGGDIGGGSWAYERENTGRHDVVGYRDYRLLIGQETVSRDGIQNFIEAGYIFDRRLAFDQAPGDFSPGNSWGIRLGVVF